MPKSVLTTTYSVAVVSGKVEALVNLIVARAAHDVEARAKVNAPVDTGNLRNSIGAHKLADGQWEVRADAEYALYVEMGTRYMAAQPFMQPALDTVARNLRAANIGVVLT
jgi:HK97 gp10 family phage protein